MSIQMGAVIGLGLAVATVDSVQAQDLRPAVSQIVSASAASMASAGKTSLAVLDLAESGGKPGCLGLRLSEEVSIALAARGSGIAVISRSDAKLKGVLLEQKLGTSGLVDSESAARMGRIAGAQVLVSGRVNLDANPIRVTVSLIDTSTSAEIGGVGLDIMRTRSIEDYLARCGSTALAATAAAVGDLAHQEELLFWQSINSSEDARLFRAYLDRYSTGTFREIAAARIRELDASPSKPSIDSISVAPLNLEAECKRGSSLSCGALAKLTRLGAGVEQDFGRAVRLYQLACNGSVFGACADLGRMYEIGKGVRKNYDKAADLYERACRGHSGDGCESLSYLGDLYSRGLGVRPDPSKAFALYERACNSAGARGCAAAGFMLEVGWGMPLESRRAASFYERACDLDPSQGCDTLAGMMRSGGGVGKDASRSVIFYERACVAGRNAYACANLGLMLDEGDGIASDAVKALSLYERACAGDAPIGCAQLGLRYLQGVGVVKNESKAAELFAAANRRFDTDCRAGAGAGCSNLGLQYEFGRGVLKDDVRATALYELACNTHDAFGCTRAGMMYASGNGVPQDLARARSFFNQGCNGGDGLGCKLRDGGLSPSPRSPAAYTFPMRSFLSFCDGQDLR